MLGSFRRRGCKCKKKRCTCGAKWYFRYDIIDPKTGKRKQKEKGGFATKGEAEDAAKQILSKLMQGTFIEEKNVTFEDFAVQWLELYASSGKVKISTVDIRQAKLKNISTYFGHIKMKDITKKMYQDMLNDLRDKYAKKTISSIHETGCLIFRKALDLEIISSDVTKHAELPSNQKSVAELEEETNLPKFLEKEQLAAFLKTTSLMDKQIFHVLFLTIAYTGMRIGEACALKWKDIDFSSQTINITKTVYNKKNNAQDYVLHTPKTKRSRRILDVAPVVLEALEQHRTHQIRVIQALKGFYHDGSFVFAREGAIYPGHPLSAVEINRRIAIILKASGLSAKITPHSLRHTHTSLLAEACVSLEQIMDRLGHQNDTVTRNVYLHVTKPRKKEASQRFADLMSSF